MSKLPPTETLTGIAYILTEALTNDAALVALHGLRKDIGHAPHETWPGTTKASPHFAALEAAIQKRDRFGVRRFTETDAVLASRHVRVQ